jgi:glycosyltransferase involved in cell wall biosynthesis
VVVAAFRELAKTEDVHLDVYSSFSIYGWEDADKPFVSLFEEVRQHPKMTYHGARPNEEVRTALRNTHAFVYPCTWPETGCRALIEAMCAGTLCATSNYGCLYETAGDTAHVFEYDEDLNVLASRTYGIMKEMVKTYREGDLTDMRRVNAKRAEARFSWERRGAQWDNLLRSLNV